MATIKLTRKQSKLFDALDNPQYNRYLIYGGARSGKTLTTMLYLLNELQTKPGIAILCLRKYRAHIKTSLWEQTLKPLIGNKPEFTFEESSLTIRHTNGSSMRLDGLDSAERVEKVLGQEVSHIFLNEASQITDYYAVKVAISRLAQVIDNVPARKLIIDLNPVGPLHWCYRVGIEHVDPESQKPLSENEIQRWFTMQFTPLDNPHLPQDYLDSLKNLTGIARRRLFEGEWCAPEGLIYPEYDPNIHLKEQNVPDNAEYIVSIDAGFNPDPTVIALWAVFNKDEQEILYLKELYYERGIDMSKSIGDICMQYKALDPYVVVDPSAIPAIIELKAKQFSAEPANNKILDGITAVRDMIRTNRVYFNPLYAEIINKEIGSYEYDDKTDKPRNNTENHWLDCLRYATMAYNEGEFRSGKVFVF